MGRPLLEVARRSTGRGAHRLVGRRYALLTIIVLGALGATATPGGAAHECDGIKRCVQVEGPWVLVRAGQESQFLLSCPKRGLVAGVDASATSRAVRLSFDGRLGAPVSPGITTTSSAFFRGILIHEPAAFFQPWLGCIAVGGGGRSTVSARIAPGAALDRRARILRLAPGEAKTVSIGCPAGEPLVSGWYSIAFYTKKLPDLREATLVHASDEIAHGRVAMRIAASDALPVEAHALVQLGAACAP